MELAKPKILTVDDTPANLVALRRLLSKVDADLVEVASGNEALAATLDQEFALILLDVNMPDMDGFEVAEHLQGEERTRETPIIFVTAAYADDLNRLKGYRAGAVDYIAKPINDAILLSKVAVFLELYRSRQQLRESVEGLFRLNQQLREQVQERIKAEAQVRHAATHDPLTGVPNRALFMDRLEQAIYRSQRETVAFALLYIDIDGFKPVNDTHGHHTGDLLLKGIAKRISERLRKEDTLARLGGDEFAVLLEHQHQAPESAFRAADELCRLIQQPFVLGDQISVQVGASIGVAIYPLHVQGQANASEALIHAADQAMYRAKKGGRNRVILAASEA